MTTVEADLDMPLSTAMRQGSLAQHSDAENATFTSELMAGRINEAGYTDYLRLLRRVYAALEQVGRDLADDPIAAELYDPALDRLAAIESDIAHWSGGGSLDIDSPAAEAYAARVRAAASSPLKFIAHHYTRYLGDLSGGLAIGRIIDRTYGSTGQGVAFYDFETIAKPKDYKDGYRARLDALPLDAAQRAEVVAEVQEAFRHNQALFDELSASMDAYRR